jgi:glucosyl-dolichyl phosphate glucuronosyltransferase
MDARITVVVVSYNRPLEVQGTVLGLLNQTVKPFEILLIDDGSDPPLRMSVDFQNFKIIRFDKERGLSNSRNFGIDAAKGDYVAFLDDDTVPSPGWHEAVQKGTVSGAEVLGGPLKPLYKARPPNWWTEESFGYYAGVGNIYDKQIWGANMIFKKDIFCRIGCFDSKLGRKKGKLMSHEDEELIGKARLCCRVLFLPEAEVLHVVPSKRMTLNYLMRWNYFAGKTRRIVDGRRTIRTVIEIMRTFANMFNPSIALNKSVRIIKIGYLIFKLGQLI